MADADSSHPAIEQAGQGPTPHGQLVSLETAEHICADSPIVTSSPAGDTTQELADASV